MRFITLMVLLLMMGGLNSCSNQVMARRPVSYQFEYGRTALIRDGVAYAPRSAPAAVKRAIAAGNRLQSMPYKWGGGHRQHSDSGYDCSGSVSYVLREAGLLHGSLNSTGFLGYGRSGPGEWITIYTRKGHAFMTVAGLRLDTGSGSNQSGPRWRTSTREGRGHAMRHPRGL